MSDGLCWAQDDSSFEQLSFCLQGIVTSLFVMHRLGRGSSGIWAPLSVPGQAAACQAMSRCLPVMGGLSPCRAGRKFNLRVGSGLGHVRAEVARCVKLHLHFFVILYELLFGETEVRPPAPEHWVGQGMKMFLAKRQGVFSQLSLALPITMLVQHKREVDS